jgi:hypothetical protein
MAMMSPIEPMTTGIWGQGKIKLEEKDDVEEGKVIKVGGKRGWVRQTLDEAVESPLWAKKATTYKSKALARKTKCQTQFLSI